VYLLDELYETSQENTSVRQIYPRIKAKMKELNPYIDVDDWYKVYDEAAAWFATELMGLFGDYFMPTAKHLYKKDHGLSLCKDQILYECITFTDRMQKLKWEVQQYVRTDKGDIPKKNDHLIDCWRYLNAAANYDMNEVIEKKKDKDPRRGFRLQDDMKEWDKESDWTSRLIPWED